MQAQLKLVTPSYKHTNPRAKRKLEIRFYRGRTLVKVNRGSDYGRAVINAFKHMQFSDYGANVAEIIVGETGKHLASIRISPTGSIHTTYKAKVTR